jgi:hypothetical protein
LPVQPKRRTAEHLGHKMQQLMPDSETFVTEAFACLQGPTTPEDDETFGPEPDDPRAAGGFEEPYEVPDFNAAYEERDICTEAHG